MKKNNKIFIAVQVILILSVLLIVTVFGAQPGSDDDPIVSKSYVDQRIDELLNAIENGDEITVNGGTQTVDSSVGKYVPVHVGISQKLIGGEGTEIIMRAGRGFAYVVGDEGVVDATTGKELVNNAEVSKNHIVIIPRDDGRGVRVVEDAWFIVKGDYTIE